MLEYIQSLSNADLLPGFLWFGIVFFMVCVGEIMLNFVNMILQKAFLYRHVRKLLCKMSEEEIQVFIETFCRRVENENSK